MTLRILTCSNTSFIVEETKYLLRMSLKSVHSMRMCLTVSGHWQVHKEHKELDFFQLVKLCKPWHLESDLCLPGKSYHEMYVQERHILPDMRDYHEMHVSVLESITRRLGMNVPSTWSSRRTLQVHFFLCSVPAAHFGSDYAICTDRDGRCLYTDMVSGSLMHVPGMTATHWVHL